MGYGRSKDSMGLLEQEGEQKVFVQLEVRGRLKAVICWDMLRQNKGINWKSGVRMCVGGWDAGREDGWNIYRLRK